MTTRSIQDAISDSRPKGLELCERTPVLFGGDPVTIDNKLWLTRSQHIEYVRYWNKLLRELGNKAQ